MAKLKSKADPDRAGLIYRTLRHAIIEQALEPGAKLPEDAIGERFGVSRTIVRRPGRGWRPKVWSSFAAIAARRSLCQLGGGARHFDIRLGLERLVMSRLAGS